MKSKLLIPVSVFIMCQAIYDGFAPIQNTNWSIFYFTSQYFAWFLLLIMLPKSTNKTKKMPYFVIASGLIIYIGIQLSKIGMDYGEYLESVNEFEAIILPIAVMLTGLTYFICKYVNNERLCKGNSNGGNNFFGYFVSKCGHK